MWLTSYELALTELWGLARLNHSYNSSLCLVKNCFVSCFKLVLSLVTEVFLKLSTLVGSFAESVHVFYQPVF